MMKKQDIVVTEELLDLFAEEFEQKRAEPDFTMNYIQWVDFRLWELANQSHAF